MIHCNYSQKQLEAKAEGLLMEFDPERLTKCKPIDVYAVIEKCLDVPYDWKYLTPDQSILGMTAFKAGRIWVWPESYYEDGMIPSQLYVEKGTIIIDSTLTEKGKRGMENFTVMHEVFHHVLHKDYFENEAADYLYGYTPNDGIHKKQLITNLDWYEYQANTCAASFLMPRKLLIEKVKHYVGGRLYLKSYADYMLVKDFAEEFCVSPTAMKYRLLNLGLADQ